MKIHSWGMATMYEGDVCDSLRAMPANSVHVCITSPPYWALRSYLKKDDPLKPFEIGSEKTPDEYVARMVTAFSEVRRVLRDDGCCFVNLGETYIGSGKGGNPGDGWKQNTNKGSHTVRGQLNGVDGIANLNRAGIPERFALAMQQNGWIWRDTIIWSKPAPMPASLNGWRWERCKIKAEKSDRERKGHERLQGGRAANGKDFASQAVWSDCPGCAKCSPNVGYVLRKGSWRTTPAHEPIFMFTKTDSYFCDAEAVKEKAAAATIERNQYSRVIDDLDEQYAVAHDHEFTGCTRNPRSVWPIGPDPFKGAHYAVFPREIPYRCIQAATGAKGCCPKCGAQVARIVQSESLGSWHPHLHDEERGQVATGKTRDSVNYPPKSTLGWRPTCSCPDDLKAVPCTVLDCFAGSFTTGEVALSMNRRAIGCELNPAYVEISRNRMMSTVPLMCSGFIGGAA